MTSTYRTSPRQAEIMISFMEKHGDLNRACGMEKLELYRLWDALVQRLESANRDGLPARTLDKWKKAWSDMKNNIKKKAARIAQPEPGRPAARLTRLEVRVLVLMGLISRTVSASSLRPPPRAAPAAAPRPPPQLQPRRLVAIAPKPPPSLEERLYKRTAPPPPDPLTVTKVESLDGDEDFSWPEPEEGAGDAAPEEAARSPECGAEAAAVRPGPRGHTGTQEAAATAVRPGPRGHTSTRAARRRGGLRGALRALARAEAARARGEARQRALQRGWQRLCARGLRLMERWLERSKRDERGPSPPSARATRWVGPPRVLHPARLSADTRDTADTPDTADPADTSPGTDVPERLAS